MCHPAFIARFDLKGPLEELINHVAQPRRRSVHISARKRCLRR